MSAPLLHRPVKAPSSRQQKPRISSLYQIESEMVLKTSKNTKTCKEKANIWLRIGFDLWNIECNLHMNAMKSRAAYYIGMGEYFCVFYLNFYYCERYDDPYVFWEESDTQWCPPPPACENGWFRDHRARSGVAGGQPGGQSSLVWTFLGNWRYVK